MWSRYQCVLLLLMMSVFSASVVAQEVNEDAQETLQSDAKVSTERPGDHSSNVAGMIMRQTNDFRKSEDLKGVESNPHLTKAAQYFANFMAKTDKYGHRADGKRPADRAEKHGYDYCIVSENIAYQYNSQGFTDDKLASAFVDGWKNSPGHRKNMLEEAVQETGVGIAQSDKTHYWYAVQLFGRPRSAAIEFSIANKSDIDVQYTLMGRTYSLSPQYTRSHTVCRPMEAKFEFPGEQDEPQTIKPQDSDKYVIVQTNGQYAVKKE